MAGKKISDISDLLITIAQSLIVIAFSVGLLFAMIAFPLAMNSPEPGKNTQVAAQFVGIYIAAFSLVAAPVLALFRISQHVRPIK